MEKTRFCIFIFFRIEEDEEEAEEDQKKKHVIILICIYFYLPTYICVFIPNNKKTDGKRNKHD